MAAGGSATPAVRVVRVKGPLQERFAGLVAIIVVCFVFQVAGLFLLLLIILSLFPAANR